MNDGLPKTVGRPKHSKNLLHFRTERNADIDLDARSHGICNAEFYILDRNF